MSDTDSQPELEQEQDRSSAPEQLKRLELVRVAAIHALVFLGRAYEYAKEKSGPLKPGVHAAESTVRASLGPVYQKLRDVPLRLLQFADRKVDQSLTELSRHVPPTVREAYDEVARSGLAGAAASVARAAVSKYEPVVKDVYAKYEPEAERYAVAAWKGLNQLPLFPQLAQIAVPTAAYWADKYNATVVYGREKGHGFAAYLPLVPVKRIAKVFGSPEEGKTEAANSSAAAASQ